MKKVYVKRTNLKGYIEEEFKIISNPDKLEETELKFKGWILASIADLINDICLGGEPIKGLIEVEEGIYVWDKYETCEEDEMEYGYIPL